MPRGVYERKPMSDSQKQKLRAIGRTRKHSLETRQKLSQSLIGNTRALGKAKPSGFAEHISSLLKGRPSPLKGRQVSTSVRRKMAAAQRRVVAEGRHPFWRGGITQKNMKIRGSLRYRLWRESVFKRDGYTCQWCGQVGGKLNADHIKPFATYPKLRFDITNGRTLCVPCHRKTDTWGHNTIH